ncbi:similar to toxr-activated gene A protein, TagA [gamma proteobacterium HdN1]|nr:similar to toxr-activated gene A protein, TagA [gamma proteobacterium HdN1]
MLRTVLAATIAISISGCLPSENDGKNQQAGNNTQTPGGDVVPPIVGDTIPPSQEPENGVDPSPELPDPEQPPADNNISPRPPSGNLGNGGNSGNGGISPQPPTNGGDDRPQPPVNNGGGDTNTPTPQPPVDNGNGDTSTPTPQPPVDNGNGDTNTPTPQPPVDNGGSDTNTPTPQPPVDNGNGESSTPTPPSATEETRTVTADFALANLAYQYTLPRPENLTGTAQFEAIQLPAWATLDAGTGIISGTPSTSDIRAATPFEVKLTQGNHRVLYNGSIAVRHTSAIRSNSGIDFYDAPFDGHSREYRNDLTGALKGEVQFVQTHAVAPNGNLLVNTDDQTKSIYRPRIVAHREALILFIPEAGVDPSTVDVRVQAPGKPAATLMMAHPNDLPKPDRTTQLVYSKRAWFVMLPWDSIVNGLSLEFIVDQGVNSQKTGELAADKIEIDRATQIVFQNLRIGMLTDPAPKNDGYFTLQDPVMAATDYFQTLPVAKLVMASYNDVKLRQTIVNKGGKARVYDLDSADVNDHFSDGTGDVYSGDMRGDVAKSQFSVGINLANIGISSWDLTQNYPKSIKMITSHHAHGEYSCTGQNGCPESGHWRVEHGLSGGNGIGTIISTQGNEASHEWGHAYGLGHWPGSGLTTDCRWADHNHMTGWGFIGHRNRLRSSVWGIANGGETIGACTNGSKTFNAGDFMFARDSMSGGNYGTSALSRYTFYTSFSARNIQLDLDNWYIADTDYTSGYKQWDTTTGRYEEVTAPTLSGKSAPVATQVGVPVVTILGGYDPLDSKYNPGERRAVIYPAMHSNYGNLFDLPAPNLADENDHCWVQVDNAESQQRLVEIQTARNKANSINQLHFNLAADFKPTKATLLCRRAGVTETLASTNFDPTRPELPPLAIVGEEHGIDQLKAREMAEIEAGLQALAPDNLFNLSGDLSTKLASYSAQDLQQGLTSSGWLYAQKILKAKTVAGQVQPIAAYGDRLALSEAEIYAKVLAHLQAGGLLSADAIASETPFALQGAPIYNANSTVYVSTALNNLNRLPVESKNTGFAASYQWVMDAQGKLHPQNDPSRCLATQGGSGSAVIPVDCDPDAINQRWTYNASNQSYKAANGLCLDNHSTQYFAELYGCHGGGNQRWQAVPSETALWLALLNGEDLRKVLALAP